MNYLILPGNPPAVHFYDLWCGEIMRQNPNARAKVSPYPQLRRSSNSHHFMHQVTEAHLANLREFHRETGQKITVVGHSLGGYFTLRMLERAPELIERAVLLHPFLRQPDPRGRWILNVASAVSPFDAFQSRLLRTRKLVEVFMRDLTHVTNEELRNMFQLAHHERRLIARDVSPVRLAPELREKVHVLYTEKDSWCSPAVIRDLEGQVALHKRAEPHGFVTDQKHRESLFKKILELP